MEMYIVLAITLFMMISFIWHKVPFGVTTMTCCLLLAMTGIMDIQSIINKGNELGAEYIVLEQDHTQLTQMESVRISMDSFHKFSGLDW